MNNIIPSFFLLLFIGCAAEPTPEATGVLLNPDVKNPSSRAIFDRQEELSDKLSTLGERANYVNQLLDKTQEKFNRGYRQIKPRLPNNPRKILDLTDSLNVDNSRIADQIKYLKHDFQDVQNTTDIYFSHAYSLLEDLKNNSNYSTFRRDVQIRQDEYKIELQKALGAIDDITRAANDIKDIEKILALYSSLGEIDDQISKLRSITTRAKNLASQISQFSSNSKKIIRP